MNFNKCSRCGCFYITDTSVCPNCQAIDQIEINRLKNYIEESGTTTYNINEVITSTGISNKNLNRFLSQEQFADFAGQIEKTDLT